MGKFNFNIDTTEGIKKPLYKSAYNHISQKNLYEIHQQIIDMNLPSGTLWCKYNLGCDYDLLNNHPEDTYDRKWFGDYYAWGELKTNKERYSWKNYGYCHEYHYTQPNLTKYCNEYEYGYKGYTDNFTKLLSEDDAATAYNKTWRTPTILDINELIDNTKKTWYKDFLEIEELRGYVFESLKDPNKNIFVPAAGYEVNKAKHHGYYGYYWASTLYTATHDQESASCMQIGQDLLNTNGTPRQFGISIRPVKMK